MEGRKKFEQSTKANERKLTLQIIYVVMKNDGMNVFILTQSLLRNQKHRIIKDAYQSTGCQISSPGKYTSGTNRTA
jgi:hypothetical protein